jgi:hypothetical protein
VLQIVARCHKLLLIRSTREEAGRLRSNVRASYSSTTIPRHLRDIVVTEYGFADLRGRTDEEVAIALVQIADARFQEELLQKAQRAGKVARSYRIPERFRGTVRSSWMRCWRRTAARASSSRFRSASLRSGRGAGTSAEWPRSRMLSVRISSGCASTSPVPFASDFYRKPCSTASPRWMRLMTTGQARRSAARPARRGFGIARRSMPNRRTCSGGSRSA